VLKDQNYKCAICKRGAGLWNYDHIDGNRSNNDISNCQALCLNCHAKKTRELLKQEKSSKLGIIIAIVIIIIIFLAMVSIIFLPVHFPLFIQKEVINNLVRSQQKRCSADTINLI
jgi:HNH endonuclease